MSGIDDMLNDVDGENKAVEDEKEDFRVKAIDEIAERIKRQYKTKIGEDGKDIVGASDDGEDYVSWEDKRREQILWFPKEEYAIRDLDQAEFLINGVIERGEVALFVGSGGFGKSTLAAYMCAAISSKEYTPKIFGRWSINPYARKGRTLFVTYEDDAAALLRRMHGWGNRVFAEEYNGYKFLGDQSFAVLALRNFEKGGPMFGREGEGAARKLQVTDVGKAIMDVADEFKPHLMVIDPAAAAFAGNENDRTEVRPFLGDMLGRWAMRNKSSVMIIAHPSKGFAEFSGSTDWQAGVRSHIILGSLTTKKTGNDVRLDGGEWVAKLYSTADQMDMLRAISTEKRTLKTIHIEKLNGGKKAKPIIVEMLEKDRVGYAMFEWDEAKEARKDGWKPIGNDNWGDDAENDTINEPVTYEQETGDRPYNPGFAGAGEDLDLADDPAIPEEDYN